MPRFSRALQRALIPAAATAVAALLAGTAPASAHVHVDADDTTPGKWSTLIFQVPNESENGSLTTQLSVTMPPDTPATAEAVPGWAAKLDRDVAAGTVRSITWTAVAGTGIAPDEFALFRVSLKLPTAEKVSFPAAQTYSDGTVVRWDQPPLPDGGEPEHPAPTLPLTTAAPPAQHGDTTALWLAVAALAVGAAGVVLTLVRRRP